MRLSKNINYYLRIRNARLKDMTGTKPFIDGSLVNIPHRCGNKNCKCARGELHDGHYLTSKVKGKTRTQYVPIGMVEEVRRWTVEYRVLKHLMQEVAQIQRQIIKRFVKEKGRKKTWTTK